VIDLVHKRQKLLTQAVRDFINADRFNPLDFPVPTPERRIHCTARNTVSQLVPKTATVSNQLTRLAQVARKIQ
jgi:hypothetical protein